MNYLQRLPVTTEEKSRNKFYIILAIIIKIFCHVVAPWSMTRIIIIIIIVISYCRVSSELRV